MLLNSVFSQNWFRQWPCKGWACWRNGPTSSGQEGLQVAGPELAPRPALLPAPFVPTRSPHHLPQRRSRFLQSKNEMMTYQCFTVYNPLLCAQYKIFRKFTELPTTHRSSRRTGSFWLIQHNLWGPNPGLLSVQTRALGSEGHHTWFNALLSSSINPQ